jgi:lysophospholipase L1-like esterase
VSSDRVRAPIAALAATLVVLVPLGSSAGAAEPRAVLDLGDSLSVGTAPYLALQLRGYRIEGYRAVGLRSQEAARRIGGRARALPRVLVVSAGTNDDPREITAFSASVSSVLAAAGTARCVVWPTIARPPVAGTPYAGLNRVLARVAARSPNLVLVDWVGMVRRHPGWLRSDRVHASSAGYRARATAIARAVTRRCTD